MEISANELYELYIDTLEKCSSTTIDLSDEEIGYNLFEEYSVGATSYLHERSLGRLLASGLIDYEVLEASKAIRRMWLNLQKSTWTIEEIKTDAKWQEIFASCDAVLLKLIVE